MASAQVQASSVLLQGKIETSSSNLFLFPGAFGTADMFRPIPLIDSSRVAVFGLNSPFANIPEQFTNVGIPEVASLYLEEIQRLQAHGPYSLLGYSVGGCIAYEVARQLILAGEAVERIYLIDSPCPLVIPPISNGLMNLVGTAQMKKMVAEGVPPGPWNPKGLLHKTQTLNSLDTYMPAPLPPCPGHPTPKTTYYIAKQGLDPQGSIERPSQVSEREQKVTSWLLDDRKCLGSTGDGWESLVDRTKLKVIAVDGNHVSIVKEPNVR